jgi:phosphate ABC transporter phosphate-binding protein
MRMRRCLFLTVLVLATFYIAGCDSLSATPAPKAKRQARLYGGGASFLNPMMQKWVVEYEKAAGGKVNYQSLGSGAGIEHTTTKTFDFGGTESPLNEKQLQRAQEIGGEVLHIPACMGAVVPTYNLPGVEQPLRFTGPVLADIFLGKITRFNDPALEALNPGVSLPDEKITVVHRSDGSGTTFVWTEYLGKSNAEWKSKIGAATTVSWPLGVGHKGNEGVAEFIARTPFTLGYNELSTAVNGKLQFGLVRNREGVFVRATLAGITAAADAALREIPDDLRYSITDAPGKDSYPVSSTTWVLVYTNQRPDKGKALVDFLRWMAHDGQSYCDHLQYARLPAGLVERIDQKLSKVKTSK